MMIKPAQLPSTSSRAGIFYGWWIVGAAFLNLFFTTGVIYSGFQFLPRIRRFPWIHAGAGHPGIPDGRSGVWTSLWPVRRHTHRSGGRSQCDSVGDCLNWFAAGTDGEDDPFLAVRTDRYFAEVVGYTLAGPIANQVLIAQWFRVRRGQAMGYAYLGLGLGGVVSPPAGELF